MDINIVTLFDYYGELLTDKQQLYFSDYYFDNLTLAEISENYDISRNAIHKQIKEAVLKLEYYEATLNLIKKSAEIKELIKELDKELKEKIEELI